MRVPGGGADKTGAGKTPGEMVEAGGAGARSTVAGAVGRRCDAGVGCCAGGTTAAGGALGVAAAGGAGASCCARVVAPPDKSTHANNNVATPRAFPGTHIFRAIILKTLLVKFNATFTRRLR